MHALLFRARYIQNKTWYLLKGTLDPPTTRGFASTTSIWIYKSLMIKSWPDPNSLLHKSTLVLYPVQLTWSSPLATVIKVSLHQHLFLSLLSYSLNVRKKAVGAWSDGVVFILFFLSALIGTRRAWQCLAWWKSVMAHWNRVGLFNISYDLSLKRLSWTALKVLGWFDLTRQNVLVLLSLQTYPPFPGMVSFRIITRATLLSSSS